MTRGKITLPPTIRSSFIYLCRYLWLSNYSFVAVVVVGVLIQIFFLINDKKNNPKPLAKIQIWLKNNLTAVDPSIYLVNIVIFGRDSIVSLESERSDWKFESVNCVFDV